MQRNNAVTKMLEPLLEPLAGTFAGTPCWNPFVRWNPLLEPCWNPLFALEPLLEPPFLRRNPCWNPPLCGFGHFWEFNIACGPSQPRLAWT